MLARSSEIANRRLFYALHFDEGNLWRSGVFLCIECLFFTEDWDLEPSLKTQLRGLVRLTRWKEHLPFVVPLTVLGALLAVVNHDSLNLDWRLGAVIVGNFLVVAYAFMINDIEDAPDDAREADRASRNPITCGEISVRTGYLACLVVALLTLGAFALAGGSALSVGAITLVLSHLYSWRLVRLKAWALTDVVSHSLMLSGLLLVAGYFTYDTQPGKVWLVAAAVTLVSVYGQLYNQLRDYAMDKAAGLHNTAIVLGEAPTKIVMYGCILLAVACLLIAIVQSVFPLWLGAVLIVSVPVSRLLSPNKGRDMRGTVSVDFSGSFQLQIMTAVNLTVAVWFAWVVVSQVFSL
jgi:4-hydroxybenzoate polyprenyltransferase